MIVFGIVIILLLILAGFLLFIPVKGDQQAFAMVCLSGGCVLIALFLGYLVVSPQYRLWRATVEKRIMVEDARAKADSAIELARAEVERAKGTAEANKIVSGSITEPYLRYLYVSTLGETSNQVIYLPTEAGLPILEAGRINHQPRENE